MSKIIRQVKLLDDLINRLYVPRFLHSFCYRFVIEMLFFLLQKQFFWYMLIQL